MEDPRCGQPVGSNPHHPFPRHLVLLTTTPKRTAPEIGDVISEGPECPTIRGHRVIREEARHHGLQPSPLFGNGVVHAVTQLLLHLSKLCSHAIAPSFALELERSGYAEFGGAAA